MPIGSQAATTKAETTAMVRRRVAKGRVVPADEAMARMVEDSLLLADKRCHKTLLRRPGLGNQSGDHVCPGKGVVDGAGQARGKADG